MAIPREFIGLQLPTFDVLVEAGRLRLFAKATGQSDAVYTDAAAARAAGHPHLPVPPTFFFCLEMEDGGHAALRDRLGIDNRRVLHGEQRFVYHRLAFAGQTLRFAPRIADIYDKKGGLLEFLVRETRVTNEAGEPVADLVTTTVIRHG